MLLDVILLRCKECNYFSFSHDFELLDKVFRYKCPECGSQKIERKKKHIGTIIKLYDKEEYLKVNGRLGSEQSLGDEL